MSLSSCRRIILQKQSAEKQPHKRKNMRDKRFVAVHRGGQLTKENHRRLIRWARACSEHVLPLVGENVDPRLVYALKVAKEWEKEEVKPGVAMKASVEAHAVARESFDPITTAIARSVGHAVATAHMADHSLGAALYALKAVSQAGKSVEAERKWQNKQLQQLPSDMIELVQVTMVEKEKGLKM
jgi:hypothetical protein